MSFVRKINFNLHGIPFRNSTQLQSDFLSPRTIILITFLIILWMVVYTYKENVSNIKLFQNEKIPEQSFHMTFYICNHNLDLQKKGNSKLKGSDTDKPCTWPLQPRTCTRLDYTGFFGKQLLHFTYIYIYLYRRIIFIPWTILYIPQTL